MVHLPPDPNDRSSQRRILDFDETVAVIVAFLALGGVLFWGLAQGSRSVFQTWTAPRILEDPPVVEPSTTDSDVGGVRGDRTTAIPIQPINPRQDETPVATPRDREVARSESPQRRVVAPLPAPVEAAPDRPLTPGGVVEQVPPPLTIADVPEDYWAYPFIVNLYENGFLPDFPEGQFQPEKPLTRAEFAALLNNALVQATPPSTTLDFSDVPTTYWATDAIKGVVGSGYMVGYPDGTFQPDKLVPRYQVLVTLANSLDLANPLNPDEILRRFQEADALPAWSRNQVAAAAADGLVVGHPDPQVLAPQRAATRAEIAAMLHEVLQQRGQVEAVESPYVAPGE